MPSTAPAVTAGHRRMFRGRGGAARHPPHRRRRRRPRPADAAENSDSEGRLYHLDSNHLLDTGAADDDAWSSSGEEASGETDSAAAETDPPIVRATQGNDNDRDDDEDTSLPAVSETEIIVMESSSSDAALRQEMAHLRQRIGNIRTAFRSVTMADPDTYQTNVLNAVLNVIHQWRHMVKYYYNNEDEQQQCQAEPVHHQHDDCWDQETAFHLR